MKRSSRLKVKWFGLMAEDLALGFWVKLKIKELQICVKPKNLTIAYPK
jgi:hypothetical protein